MIKNQLLIFILIFFIVSTQSIPSLIDSNRPSNSDIDICYYDEFIDQNQSSNSGSSVALANESIYVAQSFRPDVNILTKVYLFLGKKGTLNELTSLVVDVRKHLHANLVSYTVDLSEIDENGSWVECDVFFCNLEVNVTYYIVCHVTATSDRGCVEWYFDIDDPYPKGDPYYAENDKQWSEYYLGPEYPHFDFCFKTMGLHNNAPGTPQKPEGPTSGQYGKEYAYATQTQDIDENELFYMWSWGDGETTEWIGPYRSDRTCEASHIWDVKGSYLVKVKARDEWGCVSDWSEPLTIKMEKFKLFHVFNKIFESFIGNIFIK